MANLIEQIMSQSQAGSAEGQSLPLVDAFVKGRELRTDDLRRQTLEQGLKFNESMNALKLKEAQFNMQRIEELTSAGGQLTGYMLEAASSEGGFSNPEVIGKMKDIFLKHPALAGTAIGTQALGQITAAARIHQLFPAGTPKVTGEMEPHINAKGEVSYVPAKPEATSALGKMIKEHNAAVLSGDKFATEAYKAAIEKFGTPSGMTLKTNPDGTFEFVQGPVKTSTAAVTKAQEENLTGEAALDALDKATSAIRENPTAIGPVGIARSAMERASGILNPNAEIQTPVTDTRQKASLAFSRVAKSLRVDSGNMSRYELNKLEQAGDVLSATEAPQTALKKLSNLQDAVVGQQLRRLRFLGQKTPDTVLRKIPDAEIPDLVRDGLLSKEDAMRWHSLK
jgi:hypothetical protein